MALAVAFTGVSNSGKTTIIEKISTILNTKYKIGIVKHDPKDKAVFDKEGKDSFKFFATGAEVAVVSPTRTTYFSNRQKELSEIVSMFGDIDILLVEGLKNLPLPRICIARGEIDESYLDFSEALAVDSTVDMSRYNVSKSMNIMDLNDPHTIIEWILKNGKEI
ncbi:Molybdopterin-guanine dinucleotide biosynthesis protein B [Sulfurovum sp. enrichment culture clone C5]|uniref:Molybdopterin-guanine dinucleotide biosynthesis protein B n=1 Tax=Sulfurovum sp. enrichment culture clone C5 TaxID=497650 RepID=A0A0S4XP52_9BACT|nr:Molybdopterin-guanine dinucleotide biosynthesis protein B [Sulfurovum sp. enrichment culture clone C5]